MSYSAKVCIISWWITITISVLLWYRNSYYDRLFASILFILGLIQLVSYGCHSLMDPMSAGVMISLLLFILLFIISIGSYLYTHMAILFFLSMITFFLLIIELYSIMFSDNIYMAYIPWLCSDNADETGMYPVWTVNGESITNGLGYVFLIVVVISWLCLLHYTGWDDVGLYVIAIYIIITLMYSISTSGRLSFGPHWCYLLTGLVMIVWFVGFFGDDSKMAIIQNE